MEEIGKKKLNSSEERSHSSSPECPTNFETSELLFSPGDSHFYFQSAESTQSLSSSEIGQVGESSVGRCLDDASSSFLHENNEEISEGDLLLQKFQIPEILGRIFGMLDKRSLRSARAVSNKWNEIGLEILSKTPGRLELIVEEDDGISKKGLERIQQLLPILKGTKHPGMFFSQLTLEGGRGYDDNQLGPKEHLLIDLLQNFGSNLKSLEFKNQMTLHLSILGPWLRCWCLNLEELTLTNIGVIEDKNTTIESFQASPTPLKLNLRKIWIQDSDSFADNTDTRRNFTCSVLKSCPSLRAFYAYVWDDKADFWTRFQKLPSITQNLEEVKIEMYQEKDVSWLNGISFSEKLTSLSLRIGVLSFPVEPLLEFLERVAPSLQQLALHFGTDASIRVDASLWKIRLPFMYKLKVLEHSNFHAEPHVFDSIDFLETSPNLEIFRMIANNDESPIPSFQVDALFLNSSYLVMHPHTKLKILSIFGSPKSLETIHAINRVFPNLEELSLHLEVQETYDYNKVRYDESWLIANFKGFSEMKNLNRLNVYFNEWFNWDASINFERWFCPLTSSQSIQELTIGQFSEYNDHPTFGFIIVEAEYYCRWSYDRRDCPPGLEKVFLKIPKLKTLTLEAFGVGLSESRNLANALNQKGISVFF